MHTHMKRHACTYVCVHACIGRKGSEVAQRPAHAVGFGLIAEGSERARRPQPEIMHGPCWHGDVGVHHVYDGHVYDGHGQ